MLAVERRACIKETIQEQKSVAVSDLARRFDVTEETIRRDLKVLEAQGVLTRTYGGAFIQGGAINEVDVTLRETSYVEAKRQEWKEYTTRVSQWEIERYLNKF